MQLYQPLHAWHSNVGKRLVKGRKAHLIDSGLACALLNTSARRLAGANGARLGRLLESFAVGEVRKQISWARRRIALYISEPTAEPRWTW